MRLSYGGYIHADAECAVQIQTTPMRNEGNQYYAYRSHWTITGYLEAASQNALIAAITALEAAYSVDGGNLVLLANDLTTVAARLTSANCIGGTRIIEGPSYPEDGQRTAEFSTFRNYRIEVEGLVGTGVQLLAWTESLSYRGTGGPRFVHRQPIVDLPQKQQVAQATPVRVMQEGRAVGFLDWPVPPSPQWPADVKEDEIEIRFNQPKRYGPPGSPSYREFETTWSYPHEGVGPFAGFPNLWPA